MKASYRAVFAHVHDDVPAGIAVFLVALPLSLGIALASGAPLVSGLIAGIVGGLVVAPLSGSPLGISGAAAGLAVIVHAAIQQLGFEAFLLAVMLAGVLQIVMGGFKAGVIAYYFPSSVINGMLSGIGIILFLKQIPHAIGYDRDYEGDISFVQPDQYSSLTELSHMLAFVQPGALVVAAVTLATLLAWELPALKNIAWRLWLPGVLVAMAAGVLSNALLRRYVPEWALAGAHLVELSVAKTLADGVGQLHFPDFSALAEPKVYLAALSLAVLASLETLLAVEAVDKLDSYRRPTPTNRELLVQGLGNIGSGLLGGLPLAQVIVRSSFNIQSGAKTRLAGVVQGLLLLVAVLAIPELLQQIPLASLAAILLVIAYRLAKIDRLETMYRAGGYHFAPYCATIAGLVFTDLLTGIAIGLAVALFSILLENYKTAFYFRELHIGNKIILRLAEQVSFLNKANIQQTLEQLPMHSEVVIDATRSKYIDFDVYEIIDNFRRVAELKRIRLTIENLRGYGTLAPVDNVRPPTYESQQSLTPAQVLALLQEGNRQFVNNLKANRNLLEQINDTRQGQFPMAIILSCMDSRTSVELIFDQGLGDVFSVRVAGNVVNDDILGSMEFACKLAGSKLIVVLGHTHCGAIKGACANVRLDHLSGLLEKIKPAVVAVAEETAMDATAADSVTVQKVAERNVRLTVAEIQRQSPLLKAMADSGDIGIVGGMYDIETGKVRFYEDA